MSTTITTVNSARVDETVIAALRYMLPMLKSFSFGVGAPDGTLLDDKVYVPIATDPTSGTKTPGTMKSANGTVTGQLVTVDTPIAAGWDAIEGRISGRLFENFWIDKIAGGMYSISKAVIDAALAIITKANFGDVAGTDKLVVAPADFGQADLALLWQYGATKIKQRDVSLGLNATYAGALLGDSALATVFSTGGTNFVQTGVLPRLVGMNTWCYPAFPANAENLGGAVFGRAAILVALATPQPLAAAGQGDIVERRIITDPDSGISALYTMTAGGGGLMWGEVQLYYGVAKGQDAVVRLVSA